MVFLFGKKQKINFIGQRFGKLKVVADAEPYRLPSGQELKKYLCVCDCGNSAVIAHTSLKSGNSKSCGCIRIDNGTKRFLKHGYAGGKKTPTYEVWKGIIQRCGNPHNPAYKNYGARGITICDRWQGDHGFENFLADMGEAPQGMSIDRYPDNNGNYEPGNCRWATQIEQQNNKRINILVEDDGDRLTMAQCARKYGIAYRRFCYLYQVKKLPLRDIIAQHG